MANKSGNVGALNEEAQKLLPAVVAKPGSTFVFVSLFNFDATVMPTVMIPMMVSIGYAALVCWLQDEHKWDLSKLNTFYASHIGVTTFFLAFFLSRCYGVYVEALGYCRGTQGRIQDLFLLTSMHNCGSLEDVAKFRRYLLAAPWCCYGALDDTIAADMPPKPSNPCLTRTTTGS